MWVLVPIKPFARAKSRLSSAYDGPQRAALARRLASIALRAALGARGVTRVVALTADPEAATLATELGAERLSEPAPATDFNSLIAGALDTLAQRGALRLLYLASDLPDLTAAALEQFVQAHVGDLSIGRAARDGGTNALLFAAPRRFALAFGADSAARHLHSAAAAGLRAQLLDLPGISHDLDTPDVAAADLHAQILSGAA